MSVTVFGTCRIHNVLQNNNLNDFINYTHSTKEVIQMINFLLGNITIPTPLNVLCFRTGIIHNKPITCDETLIKIFNESTVCVVEICSEKTYIYDDYYLHHLCVDKRFPEFHLNTPKQILDNHTCITLSHDEIEKDILYIKQLIEPKQMILVTHYNSKLNGKYIPSRNNLIIFLTEIAEKYNIPIINPTEDLKEYSQSEVMSNDLGHYTSLGITKFSEYLNKYIELCSKHRS